jgi:hypothetical protein
MLHLVPRALQYKQHSPDVQRAAQRRLLETHWEHAATIAWQGYCQAGPGVLLVAPCAPVSAELSCSLGATVVTYLPAQAVASLTGEGSLNVTQVLTTMLAHYHPTQDVVVVFVTASGSIDAYRFGSDGRITPPEAYGRQHDHAPAGMVIGDEAVASSEG